MDSKQNENECIEVSAVAKILGVSTTTIYNKLSGDWLPYKRKIGGLTMVDLAALTEEQREAAREILAKRLNEFESDWKYVESVLKLQIETLKAENERLEKLLDEANARMKERDAAVTAISERLADLTERALKTTEQAQFLTAQAQAAALPEPEPEEDEPEERGWFGLPKRKKKKG